MPGVSNPGPVKGMYGIGKIYLKFIPKDKVKKRGTHPIALLVYVVMIALIAFSIGWTKYDTRVEFLLPIVRYSMTYIEYLKIVVISERKIINHSTNLEENGIHSFFTESKRDIVGTVYIKSDKLTSALYEQGRMHAADRLLQLDMLRRAASGRLSALLGSKYVDIDRLSLTLNFLGLAMRDYEHLPNNLKESIEAYAAGINAYIASLDSYSYPLEYSKLYRGLDDNNKNNDNNDNDDNSNTNYNNKFELWEPYHSLAIMRLFSYEWSISGWEDAIIENLLLTIKQSKTKTKASKAQKIIDYFDNIDDFKVEFESNDVMQFLHALGGTTIAIHGNQTLGGKPILAGDIYRELQSYGYWHQMSITTDAMHCVGLTVPGIPYIIIGRTSSAAWSMVPLVSNNADHISFIENDDINSSKNNITTRMETIIIRNSSNKHITIHDTLQGPVISELSKVSIEKIWPLQKKKQIVLTSPSLSSNSILSFLHNMNHMQSWDDFEMATKDLQCFSAHILFVDHNNIGSISVLPVPMHETTDQNNRIETRKDAMNESGCVKSNFNEDVIMF
eukprot:gene14733-19802_t